MVVVAGPPGAGKSIAFPVAAIAARHRMTSFNIDDRCAERNGSYRNITAELRREVQLECERFIVERIERREGFAVETTLRTTVAFHQADQGRAAGFRTHMIFVGTDAAERNIERIRIRALGGGHAASEATIRAIYAASLSNLHSAFSRFDTVSVYDNSAEAPVLSARSRDGRLVILPDPPDWLRRALVGTVFAF